MPILVGIDGTRGDIFGSSTALAEYDATFADSFVMRLTEKGNKPEEKLYIRGVSIHGLDLGDAIQRGYDWIRTHTARVYPSGAPAPILLTGYSRGALGVIHIAKKLAEPGPQQMTVKAMLLFDLIEMHPTLTAGRIPRNVERVLHVRRSRDARSRNDWGYPETKTEDPSRYQEKDDFRCTHGGMGGVPWTVPTSRVPTGRSPTEMLPMPTGKPVGPNDFIVEPWESYTPPPSGAPTLGKPPEQADPRRTNVTYAQDAEVSRQVWDYVKNFIREHGFLNI